LIVREKGIVLEKAHDGKDHADAHQFESRTEREQECRAHETNA
jgi:hypothetical protein